MYSRNYGKSEPDRARNLPPSYSGSAIQSTDNALLPAEGESAKSAHTAFAPFSQSIPFPRVQAEEKQECVQEEKSEKEHECPENGRNVPETKKEKASLLPGFLSGLCTEDLILLGIIAALAFGLADSDILLVALIVAVVLM